MNIIIENYRFETEKDSKERLNIYKTTTAVRKVDKVEYARENAIAWAVPLQRAIEIIINEKIDDKEDTLTLEKYLEVYIAIYKELCFNIDDLLTKVE